MHGRTIKILLDEGTPSGIENVEILVSALGHRFMDIPEPVAATVSKVSISVVATEYVIDTNGARATGALVDDGFIVFAGSTAIKTVTSKLFPYYVTLRDQLIAEAILVDSGAFLSFANNHVFASPSAAASIVAGSIRNGRRDWRLADGRTLGEVEDVVATSAATSDD
ncbi:MAG: DUF4357 domain-containing protein [Deltaproteobacteria bacterium]|nr:DUF4357 domain-containing protein [Deltaproteobacteria bacterium]